MSDIVTFGETMLRLSPPGDERLENAAEFEVRAAGAESNVAIAASRLGASATWLSKVPETALGRRVVGELRGHGIETDVVWSHRGRQGTYYLEHAGKPRGTNVIYDRENTAVSTAEAREFDLDRIRNAQVFFTTGITPALSSTLRDTTLNLLKAARKGGTTTAFDFNYRRKLWSPDEARETLTKLFPGIDVLIIAARDARTVLGFEGDPRQLAHKPEVDNEFYLGQHEIYTDGDLGEKGHHGFDFDAMLKEEPTYVVFNGQAYGFTPDGGVPMEATTGETARVYFANGGPNLLSSWHAIGNVWSRFYRDGDLLTAPDRNVETAPVAPGTTAAAEIEFPVPGPVKIVDHALTRAARRGALGIIDVTGEPTRDIYDENP